MNINATIVIQALNFFVAYALFRILFFKPAYTAIKQDQAVRDALYEQIAHGKSAVQQKEHERQMHWDSCRKYFKERQPPLPGRDQILFRNISPKIEYPELSEEQIAQLTLQATKLIIKKIGQYNGNI